MKTLEEILQHYFGCNGDAFNEDGSLTEAGEKAYFELDNLLQDLSVLEIIPNADKAIRVVNEIIEHSY